MEVQLEHSDDTKSMAYFMLGVQHEAQYLGAFTDIILSCQ